MTQTAPSTDALVPARMINEILYCERLFHLEWCQGEFDDNHFTVDGRHTHRRADQPSAGLPDPEQAEGAEILSLERPYQARAVWLSSVELGITAKIDIVEGEGDRVVPIEYKRGHAPDIEHGAYLPERAQLCAQVLLLRAHGFRCEHGEIFFAKDRRRTKIEITDELIAITRAAVIRARELAERPEAPPPLEDSPKCNGCSLAGICLPDEVHLLKTVAFETDPDDRPIEIGQPGPMRRLHPSRDDRLPLYVQSHRARISLSGERLIIKDEAGDTEARLPNTSQVAVLGNAQVTTPALRALLERDISLSFFTYGGWFLGRTFGMGSKNIGLRIAQHRAADDRGFRLKIARRLIASKILNCRTMIRRNHHQPDATVLGELRVLANKALRADAEESLLGIEGTAARQYFQSFSGMLKGREVLDGFDLSGRNRRPPRDPLNALLSFCYALLVKDLTLATQACGLDPLLGFFHRPRHGRPALALDLMEEFRPLIADSVVIGIVNTGVVTTDDFVYAAGSCAIKAHARKRVLAAYERRMDQLITHPIFEYRLSYRRVLELQARLLVRVILGEVPSYPMFRTR